MGPKRKRSSVAVDAVPNGIHETPILPRSAAIKPPPPKRRASGRGKVDTDPDHNPDIVDGKFALRASPDADEKGEALNAAALAPQVALKPSGVVKDEPEADTSANLDTPSSTVAKKLKKSPTKSSIAAKKGSDEIKAFKAEQAAKKAAEVKVKKEDEVDEWDKRLDPDGDEEGPAEDVDAMKLEARRPPPVNSDYLPLPWKGRLGYVSSLEDWGRLWLI